jgi:hypothetical protein
VRGRENRLEQTGIDWKAVRGEKTGKKEFRSSSRNRDRENQPGWENP